MNAQNLQRGNEITQRLKLLAEQATKYENAETFWDANFCVREKTVQTRRIAGYITSSWILI